MGVVEHRDHRAFALARSLSSAAQPEFAATAAGAIYSLTAYGRSVVPLVDGVRRWGRSHMGRRRSMNGP
jgi:hypothetical protein